MAAVLSLISARGGYRDEIVLNTSLIIEALSWPASQNSRLTIEHAAERYCSAAYYMSRLSTLESGEGGEEYPHYRRLLAGYDTDYERSVGLPTVESSSITVKFIPGFLRDISTERKVFLGVDFEHLKGIQESFDSPE